MKQRIARLYEQERERPCGFPRLREYVRRWEAWIRGGVTSMLDAQELVVCFDTKQCGDVLLLA